MHKLPELPYEYDALEPYIDALTMEIHYTKHHQTYVNNLNEALNKYPDLQNIPLEELLKNLGKIPQDIRAAVQNNGGGHQNHSMFWLIMNKKGGGEPSGKLANEIKKVWGNFDTFKKEFSDVAKTKFGSGWAWLSLDNNGRLFISSTSNQDTPLSDNFIPIMGLDVWEHAYYLKYHNRRVDYIQAWWHVVYWPYIEETYNKFV